MSPQHPEGHVFYRKMKHAYPVIARAEGVYLYDTAGRRYIDAAGGAIVVNVGHGVEAIAAAMADQARQVAYVHGEKFTTPIMETYAAALAEVIPLPDVRFFPLTTGSEAVEAAIKLARQVQIVRGQTRRSLVIGRWSSYHGITLGTLAVGGRKAARSPFLPMLVDMPHIEPPTCYRCPFGQTYPGCGLTCARMLERAITEVGPENVAAFIAEPVSGAALAATVPPPDYWPAIRAICDRHGVILIADEVMCGFGRTGRWCAFEHFGFTPDLLTMGKGVAGGIFPLSLLAARGSLVDELYAAGQDFNHGGTFSHHAVGAAAGLATLHYVQEHDLVGKAACKGELLGRLLRETLGDLPGVGDVRGLGLMWGVEFVQDKATKQPFDVKLDMAHRVFNAAFDLGLMTYPGRGAADGTAGDVIMLGPPAVIDESTLHEVVNLLAQAIRQTIQSV